MNRICYILLTLLLSTTSFSADFVKVGIFDISFYKVEQLIPESLTPTTIMTPHNLYSPHGASVASLIFNPEYGGSSHGKLLLMNTGIQYEDFYKGIQKAIELKIQVISISLSLINSSIAELINQANQDHGILFVVSAGNAAQRKGRALPSYYKDLKAIIASCIDLNGDVPDFAQLDSSVDILAPCGRSNIMTQIYELRRGVIDHPFGGTSAAVPQVVSFMIDELHNNSSLNLDDFKQLMKSQAKYFYNYEGSVYPVLNNIQKIKVQPELSM